MRRMPSAGRVLRQVSQITPTLRGAPTTATKASLVGEVTGAVPKAGAQIIVVPKGVYRMSMVLVTPGDPGWCCDNNTVCPPIICSGPGTGGGLGYSNCIPVVPGEVIAIKLMAAYNVAVVRQSDGKILLRLNNTPQNTDVVQRRFAGTSARSARGTGGYKGNAGVCMVATQSVGAGYVGQGVALYGFAPEPRNTPNPAGTYAGSYPVCMPPNKVQLYGASGIWGNVNSAGPGGYRIMWGGGRSFPNNARKWTP